MLEKFIRAELEKKKILLMTHLVLGYPSFDENYEVIREMAEAEVELVELQIPFSEPIADGPTILFANQKAIDNRVSVKDCLDFIARVTGDFPGIRFLIMTYYNILFSYGEEEFIKVAGSKGIHGFIIPDLPPEEGRSYIEACRKSRLNSIFIFTPTSTAERLKVLGEVSSGFVYCVGRKGVTGSNTPFDQNLNDQIQRYREAVSLPLALGFGVQSKEDVDFLTGKADIAVIGSQLIRIHDQEGTSAVGNFLKSVR